MANKQEVYKCALCGIVVEVVHAGKGKNALLRSADVSQEENGTDAAREKHVPVIERNEKSLEVRVGRASRIQWTKVIISNGSSSSTAIGRQALLEPRR